MAREAREHSSLMTRRLSDMCSAKRLKREMVRQSAGSRMIPFRVFVGGMPCDITVYSNGRGEFVAAGGYRGKQIEIKGASAISAAHAWSKSAYSSNR